MKNFYRINRAILAKKKFFLLFCAAALVLTTTAAPQFKSFKPTAQPDKLAAVKVEKPSGVKTIAPVKITDRKQFFKQFSVSKPVAKAPKAKQTTTDVVVSKVTSNFYKEDNDIYYVLYNENKSIAYCFDIICAEGQEDVESGKTYSLSDMISDYSEWVYVSDTENGTPFTAASFTKTVAVDGSYTIVASATDKNGDIFNFSYSGEAFVPQTYNLTMTKASFEYSSSYSDMYISMNDANEDYIFYFDILLPSGQSSLVSGKTYTLADMDAEYSKGADYVNQEYVNYASASFTRTDAADGSFAVSAVVVDTKGNTWNLSYSQAAPEISYQTLTLKGIAVEGSSYSQIEAASADSTSLVSLFFYSSSLEGSYTIDDLITFYSLSYVLFGGVEYDIEDANFSVAYSELAGAYLVSGTLNCADPNNPANQMIFTLELSCQGNAPVVPSTMTLAIQVTDSSIIVTPSEDGKWDWYIISPEDLDSHYYGDIKELAQAAYDYYGDEDAKSGKYEFLFENFSYSAGEMIFIAYGCNGGKADPVDSVSFVMPKREVVPSDMTFTFDPVSGGITVVPSNNTDPWDLTILTADQYAQYFNNDADSVAAYFYEKNGDAEAYPGEYTIDFAAAGLTEDGNYVLIVWGANGGVTTPAAIYAFSIGEETAIDHVDAAVKANKVLLNGQLFIEKGNVRFNVNGIQVK